MAKRREPALKLGADYMIDLSDGNKVVEVVQKLASDLDFGLEMTGGPEFLRPSVDVLLPLGSCGLVGATSVKAEIILNNLEILIRAGRSLV